MTALIPTATNIKLKFPEFASLADGTIEFAIEEAQLSIDGTVNAITGGWTSDADQTMAHMYLTAHHLMVTISRAQSGTGQRIKSESVDGMAITYVTDGEVPDPGDYNTTPYGSRYLDLVSLNFPAIAVI
jgi:Protein of unknown function (DUF4054)